MERIPLHVGSRRLITYEFDKPDGGKGRTDGDPEVTSDNESVAAVKVDGEGRFFVRGIAVGAAAVLLAADVDLGEGVTTVEKSYDFDVLDMMADHITDQIGDEETDPDAGDHS